MSTILVRPSARALRNRGKEQGWSSGWLARSIVRLSLSFLAPRHGRGRARLIGHPFYPRLACAGQRPRKGSAIVLQRAEQ
jgi:hypothetical protein